MLCSQRARLALGGLRHNKARQTQHIKKKETIDGVSRVAAWLPSTHSPRCAGHTRASHMSTHVLFGPGVPQKREREASEPTRHWQRLCDALGIWQVTAGDGR